MFVRLLSEKNAKNLLISIDKSHDEAMNYKLAACRVL